MVGPGHPRPRAARRGNNDHRVLARLDLLENAPALGLVLQVVLRIPENVPFLQEHLIACLRSHPLKLAARG